MSTHGRCPQSSAESVRDYGAGVTVVVSCPSECWEPSWFLGKSSSTLNCRDISSRLFVSPSLSPSLPLSLSFPLCLSLLCVCMCMHECICRDQKTACVNLFSFPHERPRGQTEVTKLGSKRFYLLSHFSGPMVDRLIGGEYFLVSNNCHVLFHD